MAITRNDRNQEWRNGVLISDVPVVVDVTTEAVTLDLHAKARAALAGNTDALTNLGPARTSLATAVTNCDAIIAAPVTNVTQAEARIDALAAEIKRVANVADGAVVQLGRVLRMNSQLIRLLIGIDLLVENGDT